MPFAAPPPAWIQRAVPATMRGLWIALLVAAVVLAPTAGAASVRTESWYDAEHGWAVVSGAIRSTDDGGRTWRRIGPGQSGGDVIGVVRTGPSAGLYYTLAHGPPRAFWTSDRGRHWRATKAIGEGAIGSGRFLFWSQGARLYRVTPWPGTGAALRSKPVLRLPAGVITSEAVVPGGIVVASTGTDSPHALVVRWIGGPGPRVVDRELPQPAGEAFRPCSNFLQEALVDWPVIVVPACRGAALPTAVWRSTNGGAGWSLVGSG